MAVDDRNPLIGATVTACSQRAVREQDGPAKTPGTGKNTADVIGVFMRDQYRINIIARQVQAFKPTRHFARPEAGINQYAGISGFDQQGVTPAAAAE